MDFEYRQGELLVRPWAMADAQSLHRAVRGSIATLSHAMPWCHADYALADASLWADGKRIYEANGLGMRIVGTPVDAG
jgi:hypothetical protein